MTLRRHGVATYLLFPPRVLPHGPGETPLTLLALPALVSPLALPTRLSRLESSGPWAASFSITMVRVVNDQLP